MWNLYFRSFILTTRFKHRFSTALTPLAKTKRKKKILVEMHCTFDSNAQHFWMMIVYFSCQRHRKHQGNVYCRFNTVVDISLKPLLGNVIRRCHRFVFFEMFPRLIRKDLQPYGISRWVERKRNTHWNSSWVYWVKCVQFVSGTTVALTFEWKSRKVFSSVLRAVQ